jgi:hypothetical protein
VCGIEVELRLREVLRLRMMNYIRILVICDQEIEG